MVVGIPMEVSVRLNWVARERERARGRMTEITDDLTDTEGMGGKFALVQEWQECNATIRTAEQVIERVCAISSIWGTVN